MWRIKLLSLALLFFSTCAFAMPITEILQRYYLGPTGGGTPPPAIVDSYLIDGVGNYLIDGTGNKLRD